MSSVDLNFSCFCHHFQVLHQARCAVWVAQYVIPEARGKGLDQKMFLGRCQVGF